MQINGSAITTLSFTSPCPAKMCEYINVAATGAVSSIFFDNLVRLQKLDFHATFLSTTTSLFSAFINCFSLKRIDLVGLNASLTSLQSAFQNCTSLASVTFGAGSRRVSRFIPWLAIRDEPLDLAHRSPFRRREPFALRLGGGHSR